MKRYVIILAVIALTVGLLAVPSGAITNGEKTTDHPEVVLILMEVDGQPAYRCSGALISPTFVLTAGHCAGAPGEFSGIRIFTEADVDNGDNNYPYAGPNSIEAENWAAHPDYPDAPFYYHDVGMIELAEPYVLPSEDYAQLPDVDSLDQYKTRRGHNPLTFTAVGYGLQASFPDAAAWKDVADRVRYEATPKLIQINSPGFTGDFSLLLSNNHSTGGTCFGDSGGPNYIGDTQTVGGVTSFGLNGTCGGTGGVFRMDRQNVQDFIDDFMDDPYTPQPET
jgi:secreted trypsin-like serine protease